MATIEAKAVLRSSQSSTEHGESDKKGGSARVGFSVDFPICQIRGNGPRGYGSLTPSLR